MGAGEGRTLMTSLEVRVSAYELTCVDKVAGLRARLTVSSCS